VPVLRHRVGANFQAQAEGKRSDDIVKMLLDFVGEPEVSKYDRGTSKGKPTVTLRRPD